ncbi:MAG: GGDEF domain-containing protein [Oscillospiraceae bacterium]|nr:GGDEF domain-containing protein [Oscillospiraceae bacterium]
MSVQSAQKFAYIVNTVMLFMVIGLMLFFKVIGADFLFYFSFPTTAVYIFNFVLIHKKHLTAYLWTVYGMLILYTGVTTVCLGEDYGFRLYFFSMITVVYVVEYMSFKLGNKGVKALFISIAAALLYFAFMIWVKMNGPIYDVDDRYAIFFWMFNSATVFGYLVIYTNYIIRAIIRSEKQLIETAHIDRLTGLYNRHYMLEELASLPEDAEQTVIALADIDDFKKINDTYGHNAGDEVLRAIGSAMKDICSGWDTARWGGEEFLILCRGDADTVRSRLEELRRKIADSPIHFDGADITVTITLGMTPKESGCSTDEWINKTDQKLYTGKKNGKNTIVL